MKIQFATFETLVGIQFIFLLILFISGQTNSTLLNMNQISSTAKEGFAMSDIVGQFLSNKSLQSCIFANQHDCILKYEEIYMGSFRLNQISIQFNGLKIGNVSSKSTVSCFGLNNSGMYSTTCIFLSD